MTVPLLHNIYITEYRRRRYAVNLVRKAGTNTNELRHRKIMCGSHPAARRHCKRQRLATAAAAAVATASALTESSPFAPKETENCFVQTHLVAVPPLLRR